MQSATFYHLTQLNKKHKIVRILTIIICSVVYYYCVVKEYLEYTL